MTDMTFMRMPLRKALLLAQDEMDAFGKGHSSLPASCGRDCHANNQQLQRQPTLPIDMRRRPAPQGASDERPALSKETQQVR